MEQWARAHMHHGHQVSNAVYVCMCVVYPQFTGHALRKCPGLLLLPIVLPQHERSYCFVPKGQPKPPKPEGPQVCFRGNKACLVKVFIFLYII